MIIQLQTTISFLALERRGFIFLIGQADGPSRAKIPLIDTTAESAPILDGFTLDAHPLARLKWLPARTY